MQIKYYKPNDNTIKLDAKIIEAIKLLNEIKIKLVLLVDKNNKLVGTITDGDIRRALLKNISTDSLCKNIMNDKPIIISKNNDNNAQQLLEKHNLPLPIVDHQGKIYSICNLESSTLKKNNNIIVIMAGGKGERLMPLTLNTPKPMLPINNKPIIHRIIDNAKKYGFKNICISVNYKCEQLINYFKNGEKYEVNITYLKEEEPLGTAGALSLLNSDKISDPIIVINGDVLTSVNISQLLEYHINTNKDITMCAANYDVVVPYGTVEVDGTTITDITEKPLKSYLVNAGIYVINPKILKNIKPNTKIDMTILIEKYISNKNVSIYPLHEQWIDIGSHKDYEEAQK